MAGSLRLVPDPGEADALSTSGFMTAGQVADLTGLLEHELMLGEHVLDDASPPGVLGPDGLLWFSRQAVRAWIARRDVEVAP